MLKIPGERRGREKVLVPLEDHTVFEMLAGDIDRRNVVAGIIIRIVDEPNQRELVQDLLKARFFIADNDMDLLNPVLQQKADRPADHPLAPDPKHRFRRILCQHPHPVPLSCGHDNRPFYSIHGNSLNKLQNYRIKITGQKPACGKSVNKKGSDVNDEFVHI